MVGSKMAKFAPMDVINETTLNIRGMVCMSKQKKMRILRVHESPITMSKFVKFG